MFILVFFTDSSLTPSGATSDTLNSLLVLNFSTSTSIGRYSISSITSLFPYTVTLLSLDVIELIAFPN